jgi:hypothetical protein
MEETIKKFDRGTRAAIRMDNAFSELFISSPSLHGYQYNQSWISHDNPSHYGSSCSFTPSLTRVQDVTNTYIELYRKMNPNWIATTAILESSGTVSPPSSYPITASDYIEYLQSENLNLETRVSYLEAQLREIQVYLPTMKKLLTDYRSATSRVELMVRDLSAKHGPRTGLEIAKRRDVLESPAEDLFEELE